MYIKVETQRRPQSSIWLVAIAALSLTLLPLLSGTVLSPSLDNGTDLRSDFGDLPLSFEPNEGQTDESVRFLTHASGGTLYFTPGEVVLSLPSGTKSEEAQASAAGNLTQDAQAQHASQVSQASEASVVRMQFMGANPSATIQSGDMLPGKVNYFIGNDPSKWHADLPTYSGVTYSGLYPGVNLSYEGIGSQLKGTYTVSAGSDPSQIRWQYSGAEKVTVDGTGNLQIVVAGATEGSEAVTVTEQVPVAWQEIAGTRMPVSARYLIAADQSIGFALGSYDRNHPLIIDPTLTYSTYLGGSGYEDGSGIAVDASGNAYVTGSTSSTNFPLQNPLQPTFGGGLRDVFVTKFSATGSTLLYSTYLGGNSSDYGYGIAVDTSGNAYVTGITQSTNFPLQNPFQPTFGGGTYDVFVTKFSATGSTLLYSTYLGGSSSDYGYGIAVDTSGNAYVTGQTQSTNFPLQNPFQPTHGGGSIDAFVTKLSATGSTLLYSTYLGGNSQDYGYGIAVDTSGNAYVTGYTQSTNFPLQNPFQPTFGGGGQDVFVTKFSTAGTTLLYSTYLGGSGGDLGYGIAVDTSGNAYVTGYTTSTNFPLQNPFQPTHGGGGQDVFVTKFSTAGSTLLYSTYLGGSSNDYGYGIAVDTSGNAYVTGVTRSTNFPLQNPFQPTHGGGIEDAFITKFSATGSTLIYSTYLGGSSADAGSGIAVDTSGNAYVTGWTQSTNFLLQNPFQPTLGGGTDAFVAKISDQCAPVVNGHLTYQGMPQPNPDNVQPITLQLQPTGGGLVSVYNTSTDQNGNFTINLGPLPPGTYNWWLKSPRYLASSGPLTLTGACTITQEFGTQRAGDIDNTNCVDITDFSLLRASFGLVCGDVGYNPDAEYNGDCVVDITDFGLLRSNFGTCGPAELTRPGGAKP